MYCADCTRFVVWFMNKVSKALHEFKKVHNMVHLKWLRYALCSDPYVKQFRGEKSSGFNSTNTATNKCTPKFIKKTFGSGRD